MSDLQDAYESLNDPNVAFIAVAIPGESQEQIETFKQNYGITFDFWMDVNSNYTKLIPPGGQAFPLDIVIDKKGVVRYLVNNYIPGEAVKAVEDALKE